MSKLEEYRNLLQDLYKYEHLFEFDYKLCDFTRDVEDRIFILELIEVHGWPIPTAIDGNKRHFNINNYTYAGTFNNSNLQDDKGRQPNNEFLLVLDLDELERCISNHPNNLFNRFVEELKAFEPSFECEQESMLYFSVDKAGAVLREFDNIYTKYLKMSRESSRQSEISQLKAKLAKLENQA